MCYDRPSIRPVIRSQRAVAQIDSPEERQIKKIARSHSLFLLNMPIVPDRELKFAFTLATFSSMT
jgi:hypothetical protein